MFAWMKIIFQPRKLFVYKHNLFVQLLLDLSLTDYDLVDFLHLI